MGKSCVSSASPKSQMVAASLLITTPELKERYHGSKFFVHTTYKNLDSERAVDQDWMRLLVPDLHSLDLFAQDYV